MVTGVVVIIGLMVCFNLSERVLLVGSLVASTSAFYLFVSKRIDWFKEFWVAISFSAGVLLIPLVRTLFSQGVLLVFVLLAFLALLNLLLFSWFEKDIDEKEGFRSFANVFSDKLVKVFIWTAFAIFFLLNIYGWLTSLSIELKISFQHPEFCFC